MFKSPAADYEEPPLSLDSKFIHRPAATFFMAADGDGLRESGINSGATLIIDRSLIARDNDIVVVRYGDQMVLKRLNFGLNGQPILTGDKGCLMLDSGIDFEIWGVVTGAVNQFRSA